MKDGGDPHAHRHVARRDARLEGEPDVEEDAAATDATVAMKHAQRDLTSLSGPVERGRERERGRRG